MLLLVSENIKNNVCKIIKYNVILTCQLERLKHLKRLKHYKYCKFLTLREYFPYFNAIVSCDWLI